MRNRKVNFNEIATVDERNGVTKKLVILSSGQYAIAKFVQGRFIGFKRAFTIQELEKVLTLAKKARVAPPAPKPTNADIIARLSSLSKKDLLTLLAQVLK
ncbi:MAG: hypothetical protein DRJ62_08050 [Thermoprotei archaeon]|nr:MAG: hypothetical protein DRJ62_08050 [Thermoprotei archaeon]